MQSACLPRAPCVRVQTLQYLWCRPTESVPTLYKIWQSQVRGYLTPNPIDYPSAETVRKMGTWTAVAELPILLSVFSDTDVATVLRAERELNLSGRASARDAELRTSDTPHLRRRLHLSPCLPRKGDHGRGSRLAPGGLLPREKPDCGSKQSVNS